MLRPVAPEPFAWRISCIRGPRGDSEAPPASTVPDLQAADASIPATRLECSA